MYENKTYEALLASALARVRGDIDKREGSLVMNGVAPAMAELAQLYIAADFVFRATYLATAPREYLIRRAEDYGKTPYPATHAVYLAAFNIEVQEGTRFSCEDFNFKVTGYADCAGAVGHLVTCETSGTAANNCYGRLIPTEYVNGLTTAELVELVTPADDEEDTEDFRQRVIDGLRSQAFGGNRADYLEKVRSNYGVDVKIHTAWNGGISPASLIPDDTVNAYFAEHKDLLSVLPQDVQDWVNAVYRAAQDGVLTVGGRVRLVIMDADGTAPDQTLIAKIQNAADPNENHGEGLGFAPIGHVVSVEGVKEAKLNVSIKLSVFAGHSLEEAESCVASAIKAHFAKLSRDWSTSDHLTVLPYRIGSDIMGDRDCAPVVDGVTRVVINVDEHDIDGDIIVGVGADSEVVLGVDSIPVLGSLTVELTDNDGSTPDDKEALANG